MEELVCVCGAAINMAAFPDDCGRANYGYPFLLLFMKRDGVITGCSDVPTYAEIQATIGAPNNMIVLGPITNGQRVESERAEETGADTIDGAVDVISQTLQVTGNLKFLDEAVRDTLEDLNCQQRLRMWIITNTGWIFGGCLGYSVANFISGLIQPGYGSRSNIPLDYKWIHKGKDPAGQDDRFVLLVNP